MPKKKIDRNLFLMKLAPERCTALAKHALSTRSMKLTGVEDFEGAMESIMSLVHYAYGQGVSDTIDALLDGRELEPFKKTE